MIASVRGTARHVGLDHVVVEVGGVGLLVHTTPGTAAECRTGAEVTLETTMVVREESLTLYGFPRADAKALFEQVQTVSGVGPRLALAMLSVHAPDAVRSAIARGDRVILLITGHARPGEPPVQRGRIRAAVHDWLAVSRHAGRIAAVRGAHRRHGGGGSLYIVLRRN